MFERFTTQAREVVMGAQHEARQLGHRQVGTEHLLLALVVACGNPSPRSRIVSSSGSSKASAGYGRA